MSLIGKAIGVISMGRAFTATPIYKKFLSGIAAVAALTVISGMMIGALLVCAHYAVYKLLQHSGMDQQSAMIVTAGIAAIITVVLVTMTISYLRSLFDVPKHLMQSESPMTSQVSGLADSFFDGLLTREMPVRNTQRYDV